MRKNKQTWSVKTLVFLAAGSNPACAVTRSGN